MNERGEVSITSVLVACTLMIVILAATLSVFEGFIAKAGDQTGRTNAQDAARTAADRIARDLRNLASPTPSQPQAVDLASGKDLVFKTIDSSASNAVGNTTNTKRVRYCLDPGGRLQEQTQTWSGATVPGVPSTAGCPAEAGWNSTRIVAENVVNGADPIFSYNSAVVTDIFQIHVDLLVDTDVTRLPGATRLSTGVFLRNQNRRPTASFSWAKTAGGLVLNGSESEDLDSDPLDFVWCRSPAVCLGPDAPGFASDPNRIGTGITFTYTGLAPGSVHPLHLQVFDPAGLTDTSDTQAATA